MIDRRAFGLVVTVLLPVLSAACSDGVAESNGEPERETCQALSEVGDLPAALAEASGIARDPRRDDLFWLHNDSDNDPVLFAVDTTGALAGSAVITAASNRDPEDLAVARCADGWCLYYGDIGDNQAVHEEIYVHRLPLPALPSDAAVPSDPVSPLMTYTIRYPGGARDAEALFIDAERGELGIVTKGRQGIIELYVSDLQTLEAADGPVLLERIGRLDLPLAESTSDWVTAADLSPDGSRLAVRSYTTLYLFDWAGSEMFDTLTTAASSSLVPALEPQGEGVAFANNGSRLYLASEKREARPPRLSRIDCLP